MAVYPSTTWWSQCSVRSGLCYLKKLYSKDCLGISVQVLFRTFLVDNSTLSLMAFLPVGTNVQPSTSTPNAQRAYKHRCLSLPWNVIWLIEVLSVGVFFPLPCGKCQKGELDLLVVNPGPLFSRGPGLSPICTWKCWMISIDFIYIVI